MNRNASTLIFVGCLVFVSGCGKTQTTQESEPVKFVAKTYQPWDADDNQVIEELTADSGYNVVNLNGCKKLTDASVAHIASTLPDLRKFYISSPNITDQGLGDLKQLARLDELYIEGNAFTDQGIEGIVGLVKLEILGIYNPALTAGVSKHLKGLANLKQLEGDFLKHVDDSALANLGSCTKLTKLSVGSIDATFTDAGLTESGRLVDLEDLRIEGKNVTDEGVSNLMGLSKLKELVLYRTNGVTDKGIEHLASLGALEKIKVLYGDSRIDGPGLKALERLKNLKSFSCRKLTNDSLKYIGALHQLEELDISECREIDNEGLQYIAKLENLKFLNIGFSKVTDDGLVHLRGMKSLESLFTTSTEITEKGIQDLQTHLPNLKTR